MIWMVVKALQMSIVENDVFLGDGVVPYCAAVLAFIFIIILQKKMTCISTF